MGKWLREGPKVLADGENVAAHGSQIAKDVKQFRRLLADAHHHAATW